MGKGPSDKMKEMYAAKRAATLKKIQDAIDYIQEDQRIVTKKELIEITGISSGTFSQDYVKELLKKNKVCQYKETKQLKDKRISEIKEKTALSLQKDLNKANAAIMDYEFTVNALKEKQQKMQEEYDQLNYNYKLLRGKYQQILEYVDAAGLDIRDFIEFRNDYS